MAPHQMRVFANERAAWHETPEEVEAGLAWGREKARLLHWVEKEMGGRLTARERRCIEMCFFEGLSYREAGAATGTNASSVCRAIQRSMRKLRQAAKEGDIRMPARGRTRP